MKKGMKILIGFVIVVLVAYGVLAIWNRPLSKEAVDHKIQKQLTKVVQKNASLSSALLTIYSEETGYYEQFAVGTKNHQSDEPVRVDSQYHSASIGKTMIAVIFGMLVDEKTISYDDKVSTWLKPEQLKGLFVVNGVDYRNEVTIRQLLSHTSGVADYFEGPVKSGKPMLESILANPNLSFNPSDLIAFTREKQEAVGQPGQQFYYSDTGYILLGLILEAIERKPYAQVLEERLFEPLAMKNSYLMFYQDEPANIVGIYLQGTDLSEKSALSVDWAGGSVVTTMGDLLTFMKALENGELLSDEVYNEMTDFNQQYDKGIYYGMGMMYFDFSELSFLLGSMTDVYGGVGSTGTFVLYDKANATYYIANFGSLDFTEKAINELITIRMIYNRMEIK